MRVDVIRYTDGSDWKLGIPWYTGILLDNDDETEDPSDPLFSDKPVYMIWFDDDNDMICFDMVGYDMEIYIYI